MDFLSQNEVNHLIAACGQGSHEEHGDLPLAISRLDRQEIIDLLMLLSALESWAFAQGKMLPDYLHERLSDSIDNLRNEVLK